METRNDTEVVMDVERELEIEVGSDADDDDDGVDGVANSIGAFDT